MRIRGNNINITLLIHFHLISLLHSVTHFFARYPVLFIYSYQSIPIHQNNDELMSKSRPSNGKMMGFQFITKYPPFGKKQNYFCLFFLVKASLNKSFFLSACAMRDHLGRQYSTHICELITHVFTLMFLCRNECKHECKNECNHESRHN